LLPEFVGVTRQRLALIADELSAVPRHVIAKVKLGHFVTPFRRLGAHIASSTDTI